jgi:hypothetical protein
VQVIQDNINNTYTKECNLSVQLQYPSGFKFSLRHNVDRGFARLDPPFVMAFTTDYSINGGPIFTAKGSINGTKELYDGLGVTVEDDLAGTKLLASTCGSTHAALTVNKQITLIGEFNDDTRGLQLTTVDWQDVNVIWEAC